MHANVGVRSLRDDSCENLLHVFFPFFLSPWLKWLAVIILLIFFERIMEADMGAHNANRKKNIAHKHTQMKRATFRANEMKMACETKYCTNLDVCIQILYSYNEAKRKLVQLLGEFEMKQVNL